MNEEDFLARLLEPDDDRAWKLAAGRALTETLEQARRTNGRVVDLEIWRNRIVGALALTALLVPTISVFAAALWGTH